MSENKRGSLAAMNPENLIAKAIETNVPVETMERLLAMRAELKAEIARENFFAALSELQGNLPDIPKNRPGHVRTERGQFQFKYANVGDILRAIAPKLRETGLSVRFDTKSSGRECTIFCILCHKDGHSETSQIDVPMDASGRMSAAQNRGGIYTYGKRYALCAALGIEASDEDIDAHGEGNDPRQHSHVQKEDLKKRIDAIDNLPHHKNWGKKHKEEISRLIPEHQDELRKHYALKRAELLDKFQKDRAMKMQSPERPSGMTQIGDSFTEGMDVVSSEQVSEEIINE